MQDAFKDSTGQIVQVELNEDGSVPVGIESGDILEAGADAIDNTTDGQVTSAFLYGFNGSTWDRIKAGITTATSTLTGFLNTLPWAIYHDTPTVRTNGQGGPLEADADGALINNPKPLGRTIDTVTNYPAPCEITIVDLATDADVVVNAAPSVLLGVMVDTVMSAHAALIKDSTTTKITVPASSVAGYQIPGYSASFLSNITVESDNSATGKLAIYWRAA